MSRRLPGLLEVAAVRLSAALGITVQRRALSPSEWEGETIEGVELIAALSEGPAAPATGFLMGAPPMFEFEHAARLELIARGAEGPARWAALDAALDAAEAAIAADPTLGGRVSFAALANVETSDEDAPLPAGLAADLVLTYEAPSELG